MPRALTAREMAARLDKWAKVGIDYAAVQGLMLSLEDDRRASVARLASHRKTGKLESTVRVVRPSSRAAGRKGYIEGKLTAGSRASVNGVPYAGVLQRGTVYRGRERSKPHIITRRSGSYQTVSVRVEGGSSFGASSFVSGGRLRLPDRGAEGENFPRQVNHPGSKFPALNYLQIDAERTKLRVDATLQQGANKDLG